MNRELLRVEHMLAYRLCKKILEDARLNLFEGEVVGVTGVNASGKAALVRAIAGMYPVSSVKIYVEEQEISIASAEESRKAGIYYFSRNSSLVSDFTIWENFLLNPGEGKRVIQREESCTQCREMLELLGMEADIHERVNTLSVKEKLFVEIARAVYYDGKIFILDDILDMLSATALEELEKIFDILCSLHIGIIVADNSIRYLKRYCRRLFVMRDGRTAGILVKPEMEDELIIALMLGGKSSISGSVHAKATISLGEVLMEMEHISCEGILEDCSIQIHRGEITGIFNVGKHSGDAIARLLSGRARLDAGHMYFTDRKVNLKSPEYAVRNGISFFPESDVIFPNLTLEENIMFPALKMNSGILGVLNKSELKYAASELMSRYIIDYEGIHISESQIEQNPVLRWKISFCRMLSTRPELAVMRNPGQSMDITSKGILYDDIRSLNELGVTAMVITSDMKELFAVSDVMIVVNHGKAEAVIRNDEDGREQLRYLYGKYLQLI